MRPMRPLFRLSVVPLLALALFVSGCAHVATYNASYVGMPATSPSDKLPGRALILTDKSDDDTPFVGPPTSFTGGATTLTIHLGVIAREIGVIVFGDLFRDGAVKVNVLEGVTGYRVAVKPRVTSFSYEYNQLKNLGFAITPTVVLTLEVSTLDSAGKFLHKRYYESGTVEMPAYMISGSPGEEIGKGAHKALYDLMQRAANDLRNDVRTSGDPALAL